jgi:hypothetical protein
MDNTLNATKSDGWAHGEDGSLDGLMTEFRAVILKPADRHERVVAQLYTQYPVEHEMHAN